MEEKNKDDREVYMMKSNYSKVIPEINRETQASRSGYRWFKDKS